MEASERLRDGRGDESLREVEDVFHSAAQVGAQRLRRPWLAMLATGWIGGLDVSTGVFGMLAVQRSTGNVVAASLTFSIGFLAVVLAKGELFTENFLVPILAVVSGEEGVTALLRLWVATVTTNIAAGGLFAAILILGFRELQQPALSVGEHYVALGLGSKAFASAMLGGALVTLMTWMIESNPGPVVRVVAALATGYLLAVGRVLHCIVASIELFLGLFGGAPYGYGEAFAVIGLAVVGNALGGILLVTVFRLAQAGALSGIPSPHTSSPTPPAAESAGLLPSAAEDSPPHALQGPWQFPRTSR